MMFSGWFDLPWWGLILVALALTHVTIAAVTIFLHRCQAHRALELHPLVSHFFRFWLWLTTGMVTKEWAAIHRKHHAKCETVDDPHSPQIHGINRVLWTGVFLYVKESYKKETIERYGHGTPDDWIERNLYSRLATTGVVVLLATDMFLFGVVPGALIWATQVAWIPFWAAGVINGVGHWFGYRNFGDVPDASRNIVPWGMLIGGEELHNNHHAYASSAKLSSKWYEFDIGWLYIRMLETLNLAQVKKLAPQVKMESGKSKCDLQTLQAVITHRYDVLARFTKSVRTTCAEELRRMREHKSGHSVDLQTMKRWLHLDAKLVSEQEKVKLDEALSTSKALTTVYSMRQELAMLWQRSTANKEQLLSQLEDWCHRAEKSDIAPLRDFSRTLRCYA